MVHSQSWHFARIWCLVMKPQPIPGPSLRLNVVQTSNTPSLEAWKGTKTSKQSASVAMLRSHSQHFERIWDLVMKPQPIPGPSLRLNVVQTSNTLPLVAWKGTKTSKPSFLKMQSASVAMVHSHSQHFARIWCLVMKPQPIPGPSLRLNVVQTSNTFPLVAWKKSKTSKASFLKCSQPVWPCCKARAGILQESGALS